ncbi:copper chaperone PCu(A)C [Streptomyces formicae]|uniref:Cytoplasmic membrane protein FsxA n=1 Tax=Streptomyces formicae TaxID=1616117 RepID=A0A291Q219_9ACTN|nr:copper chaperone PCu(A)C [Streptomyces formicae]ATL25632.1 Cytoplasmic membrane protein FsxA [Streptomyces formicae]
MTTSGPNAGPSRSARRLKQSVLAAVAPVVASLVASLVALGGLTAWTALGNAGTPPDVSVTRARVFQPTGGTPNTAAFFRITNRGGSADELTRVTSPSILSGIALSRHRMTPDGAAYRAAADRLRVPAHGTLDMTPMSSDVTVPSDRDWRMGDRIPFDLHFEHSGTVRVRAEVVRPGTPG